MEYYFHHAHFMENNLDGKPRDFRFDFCVPDKKIAFELEGGLYTGGRHIRPLGFMTDCVKYNLATLLGWHVYRFPTNWLMSNDFSYISGILDTLFS